MKANNWLQIDTSFRYLPSPVTLLTISPSYLSEYRLNSFYSTIFLVKYIHHVIDKFGISGGAGIAYNTMDSGINYSHRIVTTYSDYIFQLGVEYKTHNRLSVNLGINYETKDKPDSNEEIFKELFKLNPISFDLCVSLDF